MANIFIAGLSQQPQTNVEVDFPRPERLIKGNPQRQTQNFYNDLNMDCGIWQCEVGAWHIEFAGNKQEFFQIIDGIVRLHDSAGHFVEIRAGQAGIIPPNFQGTFEVVEAVKKYYVVVTV